MPKGKKGARKGRRPAKKQVRRNRKVVNVSDYAGRSVVRSLSSGSSSGLFDANQLYSLMNTSLEQYDVAVQIAQAYQHYRIKSVSLKVQPQFDSYVFSGTQTQGKPNLYYMIDKSGTIPTNITLEGLKQMGARPRALDEKPIVITWRPSVLTSDMTTGGAGAVAQPSQYKISPWLSTSSTPVFTPWNANSVDHLGIYWLVDSTSFSATTLNYKVDVEVQFEFKKPLWAKGTSSQVSAIPARPAITNDSRDGIVGGTDDSV